MSHGTMSQENNSVTVTTGNNEKLRTMTRTMATGALDTIDALHRYLLMTTEGGNITLRSRMDLLIHQAR
jgi:hypothetical protein